MADNDQAVQLGHQALARYHRGEWQAARDEFVEADHVHHSAVFRLYAARAERNLGHLLEAIAIYESITAEEVLDGPPEAVAILETAAADAVTELEETRRRTPSVRISVKGEAADNIDFKIDGAHYPAPLPATVELNPGRHRFEVFADGRQVARQLELTERQKLVPIELWLLPKATTSALLPRKSTEGRDSHQRKSDRSGRSHSLGLPPLIAFAVGASGLIVGVIAGSLVYADSQDIKKNCEGTHCLVSDQAKAGSASNLGRVATAGFAIAGLGAATGFTLVLLKGSSAFGSRSGTPSPTIGLSLAMDLHAL